MDSVESIDRLVEIEHQAAAIIHDAEEKASKMLLDAKTRAESLQQQKIIEARKNSRLIMQPIWNLSRNKSNRN